MGLSLQTPIFLTAEEVMQIMKQSADDIDVADSRNPDPDLRTFYESDLRWLRHYGFLPLDIPSPVRGALSGGAA